MTGKVVDHIKGGLVVDIGVRAFLPASQADLRPVHELEEWKDRELEVRVLKLNRKRGNVVVSRRAILEEEQLAKRQELLRFAGRRRRSSRGAVKNITGYGVFVDLGGIDGLLHVTDMSWGRVTHPARRGAARRRNRSQDPEVRQGKAAHFAGAQAAAARSLGHGAGAISGGRRVQGKIVGVTDYGAFVELEPGVEGLVHVSEMSWSKRKQHPSKLVKVGDEVEVVVLDVEPDQRRISLGLKQAQPDPWRSCAEKYPVGTMVSGRIRNLTEFGAFVEIEEGSTA